MYGQALLQFCLILWDLILVNSCSILQIIVFPTGIALLRRSAQRNKKKNISQDNNSFTKTVRFCKVIRTKTRQLFDYWGSNLVYCWTAVAGVTFCRVIITAQKQLIMTNLVSLYSTSLVRTLISILKYYLFYVYIIKRLNQYSQV